MCAKASTGSGWTTPDSTTELVGVTEKSCVTQGIASPIPIADFATTGHRLFDGSAPWCALGILV